MRHRTGWTGCAGSTLTAEPIAQRVQLRLPALTPALTTQPYGPFSSNVPTFCNPDTIEGCGYDVTEPEGWSM